MATCPIIQKPIKIEVYLQCAKTGKTARVIASQPKVNGGMWVISERSRRAAFGRLGVDWRDQNAGVTATSTIRAVDRNGWPTYVILDESNA